MRQFSARLDNMLGKPREPEFRVIPQRFAILEVLSGSEDHPGAEEIYAAVKKSFPTTSIATVYKTLAFLYELLSRRLDFYGIRPGCLESESAKKPKAGDAKNTLTAGERSQ